MTERFIVILYKTTNYKVAILLDQTDIKEQFSSWAEFLNCYHAISFLSLQSKQKCNFAFKHHKGQIKGEVFGLWLSGWRIAQYVVDQFNSKFALNRLRKQYKGFILVKLGASEPWFSSLAH